MGVLDVFAGAGGLSTGLAEAGFEVVGGVERDRDACETFAKAHPSAEVVEGDVGRVPLRRWRDEVEVVAGGPPCQPWSTGGKRLGPADARDGWPAYLRVLDEVRPRAFVAENVAGLASRARRAHLDALLGELAARGFVVTSRLVDAAGYGVPQHRHRLVVVGVRGGPGYRFPEAGYGPGRPRPWVAAGSVVGIEALGVPNPSAVTYARRPDLRADPYGGHLYNGGGRPLDLARPARTLLASMGGNKTPWVDTAGVVPGYHAHLVAGGQPRAGLVPGARRITVEEAALLQTFPPATAFAGARSSRYRQVGNAVPPALARAVGAALAAHLAGD